MNEEILGDFADMEKRLKFYVDKGRVATAAGAQKEPLTVARPNAALIKPLRKVDEHLGCFLAVDCSTRTLKRANNWGVYLMRATYALVEKRKVDWGYQERLSTVVGDAHTRSNYLTDVRIELESQVALGVLRGTTGILHYEYTDPRSNYFLLDGGGYFGGERKFRVSLYDECEKAGVTLLAVSKNSPSLHDEKGRDLIATASTLSPYDLWVYHPVRKADKDKSLYGDISLVKLCRDSPRVFRCDVMQYLTEREVSDTLAPLTAVAEDPRALGYPVPLWLAHRFSAPSETMLLAYHDQIESQLAGAGLLETLRREESTCSFSDELHGVKHAFNWEWWNGQF